MSRPGEVEPRAAADAGFGATAALQRLAAAAPLRAPSEAAQGRQPARAAPATAPPAVVPDLNDGYDQALLGPSERPNEPITAGINVGPGPNWTPQPFEDDRTFMLRVADDLSNDPKLSAFVAKIREGG